MTLKQPKTNCFASWRPMHVRIQTDPLAGSLRVLTELPDYRLARLEGHNGIGKTLAVRLLQLCVGRRPYPADSRAWKSLSESLGPFRVEVDGLRDGRAIVWVGDSRTWTTDDDDGSGPVRFESITIGGEPADVDAVRALLAVERLAGDERLVDTLATEADNIAAAVRRWLARHADPSQGSLAALQSAAFDCQDLLRDSTQQRFKSARKQLREADERLLELGARLERTQIRVNAINDAQRLAAQLAAIREAAPEVNDQFSSISRRVEELERERAQRLRERDRLVARADRAGEWQRELRNAERTEANNLTKVRERRRDIATLSVRLGVDPTSAALQAKIAALRTDQAALEARRRELDKAREVRPVLDRVSVSLAEAERQELGEQIALVDVETGLELSIAQTRRGVAAQATFLRDKPPAPEWAAVNKELEDCNALLAMGAALRELHNESAVFAERARKNRERADFAVQHLGPEANAERQAIEAKLKELEDLRLHLAEEQAALAERLRSDSPESELAVATKYQEALEVGEVDEHADLGGLLAELRLATEALHSGIRDVNDGRDTARAELQQVIARTGAAYLELVQGRLAWANEAVPAAALARRQPDVERQLEALEPVRAVVDVVYDRLSALRGQLDGVASALATVARGLRGEPALGPEYVPEVERWLNGRFAEWFNRPGIRNHLLPRAQGEITIDVASQEVRWSENGAWKSQPIESLSSGQQAYAYTQARLHDLDTSEEERAPNRLIVLDEFGAFVAHDLLYQLEVWLRAWVDEHPGDQLLIILPLSQDYAERANHTLGPEAGTFRDLAAQVATRRYAVRELSQ